MSRSTCAAVVCVALLGCRRVRKVGGRRSKGFRWRILKSSMLPKADRTSDSSVCAPENGKKRGKGKKKEKKVLVYEAFRW